MTPKELFSQNGITLAEAASAIGVHHTSLSRVLNGDQWPSPAIMDGIDKLSGGRVTVRDWLAGFGSRLKQDSKGHDSNGRTRTPEGLDKQTKGRRGGVKAGAEGQAPRRRGRPKRATLDAVE